MEPNKELEQAIENKFLAPPKFAIEIEKIVAEEEDFNYIDAICYYCETNNIEVESVSKLISKPCLLYTSPSPRDDVISRMPSSA